MKYRAITERGIQADKLFRNVSVGGGVFIELVADQSCLEIATVRELYLNTNSIVSLGVVQG